MNSLFKTQGPLAEAEAHLYVEREEDAKVINSIRNRTYVTLIGARQTGKSSLLYKLRARLREEGWATFLIDVSPAADQDVLRWYEYLSTEMQTELDLASRGTFTIPLLRDQIDFRQALRTISRTLSCPILFMLDEVGTIPEAVANPFLAAVRAIGNRKHEEVFGRYVFILAGTFVPDELMTDARNSPFNISKKVYMSDATEDSIAKLIGNLEKAKGLLPDDLTHRIYHWTAGHLYLTQRFCSILEAQSQPLTVQLVDEVKEEILRDDDNIRSIRNALDRDQGIREAIYSIMLTKKRSFDRTNSLTLRLELTGLIKADAENNCVVRNRIYQEWLKTYFRDKSQQKQPQVIHETPGISIDARGNVLVICVNVSVTDARGNELRIPLEALAPLERDLFNLLYGKEERVCTYREITDKVWGKYDPNYVGGPIPKDAIHAIVRRLREKIEPDPSNRCFIRTVHKEGYKLVRSCLASCTGNQPDSSVL